MGTAPGARVITAARGARAVVPVRPSPTRPCGYKVAKPSYDHVMWVFMENESFASIIGAPEAPYATSLARRCGLATNYYALGHPSLPNYLGATGGTTGGVSDDGEPSAHPMSGASIFSQVDNSHLTWRAYAESMPRPCDTVTSGSYAARHNPAVYYTALAPECARDDVAMGTITGGALHKALYTRTLANFVFVTPNICDDAHSCPVAHGDEWLSRFLTMVFASPTYADGHLVVFLVSDEGNSTNQVPLIVAAPSVPAGRRSAGSFDHYSLLGTTERLLGLFLLLNAARAPLMVTAFNL
jgi:hypothetical protein